MTPDEPAAAKPDLKRPIAMRWQRIMGACVALPALVGLISWLVFSLVYPAGVKAAWVGSVGVAVGALVGPLLIVIWKPRKLPEWPMLLMACQMVSFVGSLACSLSLYSATHPDPLLVSDKVAFAVVVGASVIAVLVAHTRLFAAGLRAPVTTAGTSAEPAQTRP